MKFQKSPSYALLFFVFLFTIPSLTWAQNENCAAKTLEAFYDCYGGKEAFNAHSISALSTFIQVEDAIHQEEYAQAKTLIDLLFATYPKGSNVWWSAYSTINGSNIGSPHTYYGLRMMEDIIDHHLNTNTSGLEVRKVYMKVVLVGCSEGVQPTNLTELENGTGPFITNSLDPALKMDDYRIVKQSYDLFTRYVHAITKGQIDIEVEIIELPQLCLDVSVSRTKPYRASGSIGPVWNELSDEVKNGTDFWVITYPSHVPEQPAFDNESFITGGMGGDTKGGPVFIADDKWIVRKPAHLGAGTYSDIERRAYLPQWYQHEFFHHLFRLYPEFSLEVNGHDWFDKNFWPADFEGQFETDFYAEALHKRLQTACVPLATSLITRIEEQPEEQLNKLSIDELLGAYSLDNIQNNWHEGEILQRGNQYFWRNKANVEWEVMPNLAEGILETGADCPYPGQDFSLELYQTIDGKEIAGVVALKFQSDIYQKRFNLLREKAAFEIALGSFTRVPYESGLHAGTIVKEAGKHFWENELGDRWSLTPNSQDESFALNSDSPTPDQDFQLILSEDECDIWALGFNYLGYYYWREKRDLTNGSPILVNPIADLQLDENFDPYSIDLSNVFSDPEGDLILHFATSTESDLVSATIDNQELVLNGGEQGLVTIFVTAIDPNGGRITDEFKVQVGTSVATQTIKGADESSVSIFPNLTKDSFTITILGEVAPYDISIFSVDGSFQKKLRTSDRKTQIDVSDAQNGVYLVRIVNQKTGQVSTKKLVKYY